MAAEKDPAVDLMRTRWEQTLSKLHSADIPDSDRPEEYKATTKPTWQADSDSPTQKGKASSAGNTDGFTAQSLAKHLASQAASKP
eukprot:Clim_evm58s232 gene=Clim_evmTU58s232